MADQRTLILAADDAFFRGYEEGYLHFVRQHRENPLTDEEIAHFLFTTIVDPCHSQRYNAGTIAGWIAALFNRSYRREESVAFTVIQGGRQV